MRRKKPSLKISVPNPVATEIDEEADGAPDADNPVSGAPPVPEKTTAVKPTVAADFVTIDQDRPKADDSPPPLLPEIEPLKVTPTNPRGGGRPRTSNSKEALRDRERYARRKAQQIPPPSFYDLPAGGPGGAAPAGPAPAHVPPPVPGVKLPNYKMNAEICFGMATGALSMMLSDEWQPQNETEKGQVVDALARYMEHKRWDDLSPGWALTVVTCFYVMPRLSMPKTKEKLSKLIKKLKREEEPNVSRL